MDKQEIVDLGRAVERLYESKDFQKVILDGFINKQILALGIDFDASTDEVDTLKAITHLSRYLAYTKDQAKIQQQTG